MVSETLEAFDSHSAAANNGGGAQSNRGKKRKLAPATGGAKRKSGAGEQEPEEPTAPSVVLTLAPASASQPTHTGYLTSATLLPVVVDE